MNESGLNLVEKVWREGERGRGKREKKRGRERENSEGVVACLLGGTRGRMIGWGKWETREKKARRGLRKGVIGAAEFIKITCMMIHKKKQWPHE